MSIQIQVRNKVAVNLTPEEVIVCGNSGYEVEFSFDAEWASEAVKTARFVYRKGGQNYFDDVVFSGATAKAPVLSGITYVLVGVYAGDLITTTPAVVECEKSILCGSGVHKEPTEDVYNQLVELINSVDLTGYATKEWIQKGYQPKGDYLENDELPTVINTALAQAKASREFDGKDGVSATHEWNGTVLTITSASGTSSADLKGPKGDPGKNPVCGTDYWTAADIAEIKSYVDEAILGGAW